MTFFKRLLFSLAVLFLSNNLFGQSFFPVKINQKWGLIDTEGKLVVEPQYDAIGEFQPSGLAVMQRNGLVGIFDHRPVEVIAPLFEDAKILNKSLISVKTKGSWKVINLKGQTVLPPGFQDVENINEEVIKFKINDQWGLVDKFGNQLCAPKFGAIAPYKKGFFKTKNNSKTGLLNAEGKEILPTESQQFEIIGENMVLFKQNNVWGAVDLSGKILLDPEFQSWKLLTPTFIKFSVEKNTYLYSVKNQKIINDITFENFFAFSNKYVLVKKDFFLGLMNAQGNWVIPAEYNEIQPYGKNLFRVRQKNLWGIVNADHKEIIPFNYQYIAPIKHLFCLVKKDGKFGACNLNGELVIEPLYSKIEFEKRQAKCFSGNILTVMEFDNQGQILDESNLGEMFTITIGKPKKELPKEEIPNSDLVLEYFEWFYEPTSDKWGLRSIESGENKIDPIFDFVRVDPKLHLTLVGNFKNSKVNFDQTSFRWEMVFGLVENITGNVLADPKYRHLELEDFRNGQPLAHCIFENGKHGLISRNGVIIQKDYAYIGEFSEGLARMSKRGKLSGKLNAKSEGLGNLRKYLDQLYSPYRMMDFTAYDQEFEQDAELTCDGCAWGYLDTLGKVRIKPQFDFAKNFTNDVGIVKNEGKWGAFNFMGKQVIPFEFDEISFLDNTDNKVIRVYKKEPKYGLIDTLGQIQVGAVFDDIGSYSESKLAVKRNNLWGFVNNLGTEIIPCRFQSVSNFSEGLAAVKNKNNWGFADANGNMVLPSKYIRAGNFNNGKAWIYTSSGYTYIDNKGIQVFDKTYQKAFDYQFRVARVVVDGKYGLIDPDGNFVIEPKYSEIEPFDQYGLAKVRYGSDNIRYGLINLKGTLVTQNDFKEIYPFHEGLAAVKYKDQYGFINIKGEIVIKAKYSKVSNFSEGFCAVQQEGRCGFINKKGKWLVEPQFSKCLDFNNGIAVVYMGLKKAGLLDKKGNVVVEPKINRLLDFSEGRGLVRDSSYRFYYITEKAKLYDGYYQKAGKFQHGVAVVQMDGKWGIINQKGIEITPPKYDKITEFKNGYAKVRIRGFNGLTNNQGEAIVQPDYEYISYAGEGLFRVEQGDKVGYFDANGKWVWNLTD